MTRRARNPVNRKKLPMSKWTAVSPVDKEKHFLVVDWVRDDDGAPTDRLVIADPVDDEKVLFSMHRRYRRPFGHR